MPLQRSLYPKPQSREESRNGLQMIIAETADKGGFANNLAWTTQDLRASAVYLYAGELITGVAITVSTGSVDASVHVYGGLYDDADGNASGSARSLLASSADTPAAVANATTVPKAIPFSTPYRVPKDGVYYPAVLIIFTAGTTPQLLCTTVGVQRADAHTGGKVKGFMMASQASLPATATFTTATNIAWMGVY